jgi:transcriptional regulator with XRE-family HTH domain
LLLIDGMAGRSTTGHGQAPIPATERESIGSRIRRLRKLRGLTIQQLAVRTRSSMGYISQLENRPHKSMSLEKVGIFAQALEVPEHVLLDSGLDNVPEEDREFVAWFLALPPEAKGTFKALMDWYVKGRGG